MLARRLLESGFLPRELPPIFSSTTLGRVVGNAQLPACFTQQKAMWTAPVQHDLARPGGLRRRLTIPNPINYFRLASFFENQYGILSAEWSKSPYSCTRPKQLVTGARGIVEDVKDRATPRARARVGARYILKTDVAQFYPSIYTHSIPWVLHTKPIAKASTKNMALIGNVLDKELQACQLGQTKGIAIGPDTSLGVAELLLSPIDEKIQATCKPIGGCRFIDDVELTFRTLAEADRALVQFEALLRDIELQPNAIKTSISEMPASLESSFVTSLRSNLPSETNAPKSQWIDYFNRAFDGARLDKTAGTLRYAVAALASVRTSNASWDLAQRLLWQCITVDPGCIRNVVDVIAINQRLANQTPDRTIAASAVESVIQSSAAAGHASEVLWCIWAAMYIGFPISPASQDAIESMDDALVAAAAMLSSTTTNVFLRPFNSPLWKSWFQQDCFSQEHWLFVYEAYRRGWFAQELAASGISGDANAAFLHGLGVTFLVNNAPAIYQPVQAGVGGGVGGGY